MNLTELTQQAIRKAIQGHSLQINERDAEALSDALVPEMFRSLAQDYVKDGRTDLLAMKTKTLAFINGSVALSSDVLHRCLELSTLSDSSDLRKLYAYVEYFPDFIRTYDRRLGYYHVQVPGTMLIVESNATYTVGSGLSGNRSLTTPCVWDIPATASAAINAIDEVTVDMVTKLAEMLKPANVETA